MTSFVLDFERIYQSTDTFQYRHADVCAHWSILPGVLISQALGNWQHRVNIIHAGICPRAYTAGGGGGGGGQDVGIG